MVSYLQIENLQKSYGDRLLFSGFTFGVYQGDKIGLVAPNGFGKSTLLNIIAGDEDYDSGNIVFRNDLKVGFLPQKPDFNPSLNPIEYILDGVSFEEDDRLEEKARKLLHQLKVFDTDLPLKEYSGGYIKRIALAKTLISDPDLLILDEPTNHLDIEIIEWLEKFLSKSNVTLIMVTHDRYFLDRVCNKIIEIDQEEIFIYEGNYEYFIEKREERHENLKSENLRIKNLLRKELDWMRRQPKARGTKAKFRIDNFNRLTEKSKLNLKTNDINLGRGDVYIGSKIFEAKDISKSFGDKVILKGWNYNFARYEKIGIIGKNGTGKTTFLRLLLGELTPDAGTFDVGSTVKWGYYSQEGMMEFDKSKKVIDAVKEIAENIHIDEKTVLTASQFLTRFLFSPDTQNNYIHKLSGGELRRLYLATVLIKNPNFLILDEPTNDLDIQTLAILEEYLINFKGCVIVVSHDRYFIDRIVNHVFVFNGDGDIKDFPGNFSQYRIFKEEEKEEAKSQSEPKQKVKVEYRDKKEEHKKLTFKEKRELEELELRIPALEKEKNELEVLMSSGSLSLEELNEKSKRIEQLMGELDTAEIRALELMEKEG